MSHNIKPINNSSEPSAGKSFLPNVMKNQHNVMSDEPTTDSESDGKLGGGGGHCYLCIRIPSHLLTVSRYQIIFATSVVETRSSLWSSMSNSINFEVNFHVFFKF